MNFELEEDTETQAKENLQVSELGGPAVRQMVLGEPEIPPQLTLLDAQD